MCVCCLDQSITRNLPQLGLGPTAMPPRRQLENPETVANHYQRAERADPAGWCCNALLLRAPLHFLGGADVGTTLPRTTRSASAVGQPAIAKQSRQVPAPSK